jgi:hypothetical protein
MLASLSRAAEKPRSWGVLQITRLAIYRTAEAQTLAAAPATSRRGRSKRSSLSPTTTRPRANAWSGRSFATGLGGAINHKHVLRRCPRSAYSAAQSAVTGGQGHDDRVTESGIL